MPAFRQTDHRLASRERLDTPRRSNAGRRALRLLPSLLLGGLLWLAALPFAGEALAGPPTNTRPGGTNHTKPPTGYQPPDFTYGGNAVSFMGPLQFGLTKKGFVPRGRFHFQYDRQLHKAHWVHVGAAAVFDRGSWRDFGMDACGLEAQAGTCQAGTTAGMDMAVGYTHKLFIEPKPWIVPTFRLGLAGGFWYYPRLGGTREQTRELTWTFAAQVGAGVRFFLLRELAIGIDIEFRPGLAVHREREAGATDSENVAGFVLPMHVLPLVVEWRF